MTDNLTIWNNLSKTDPKHTKQFQRAGGFKGTAIKPIWLVQRLTEQFGPVGIGWGMEKPEFELVPAGNELLVFCTLQCWHTTKDNTFFGVGGDKAIAVFKSGPKADDEAFKKAFTDALGNAFKFTGSGADVHMGQFDDSKYVQEMAREFAEPANDKPKAPAHSALKQQARAFVHEMEGCGDADELSAFLHSKDSQTFIADLKEKLPQWWDGGADMPAEFIPLRRRIEMKEYEFASQVADVARA